MCFWKCLLQCFKIFVQSYNFNASLIGNFLCNIKYSQKESKKELLDLGFIFAAFFVFNVAVSVFVAAAVVIVVDDVVDFISVFFVVTFLLEIFCSYCSCGCCFCWFCFCCSCHSSGFVGVVVPTTFDCSYWWCCCSYYYFYVVGLVSGAVW